MVKHPKTISHEIYSIQDQFLFACRDGDLNEVNELFIDGVQVNQANNNGATPLVFACHGGHLKVVKMLLAVDGILANQANNKGWTPLNIACQNGIRK